MAFRKLGLIGPLLLLLALSTSQGAPQDRLLRNADADIDNWRLHGRTYDNQRYSPLTDINRDNVARLKLVRRLHTGVNNSFEATPLVIDGVLYLVTATNHVQAWDAQTGRQIWAWQPDKLDYTEACCGPQARGVAVAYGKVYTALFDGHLVALDAGTGKLVWQTDPAITHPEPKQYYTYTQAPQVHDGMVFIGTAGAEYETRGMVEAYDAQTGRKSWEFRTTAAPGEPGGDTWKTDAWKFGGGSVWNTPAIDTRNDLVIFATGNPNPDYQGESRPGDNAYTDSIVAVHARTGQLAWWYQEVAHDLWDYDASAPVMLFDARTGQKLWTHHFDMGVCSPPMTYRIKGVQYLAVGVNGCRGGHVAAGQQLFNDEVAIFALETP